MSDSVIMGADLWIDTSNQWKRLEYVQLPALNKMTERFVGGGAWNAYDIPLEMDALSSEFGLKGSHSDVRSLMGREAGDWTKFYVYERLRDIMAGVNAGRVVTMKALIQRVQQPRVTGRRADATTYTIGSIVEYKDVFNGTVVHWIDVNTNKLVLNGNDYSSAANALLGGIGGTPSLIAQTAA